MNQSKAFKRNTIIVLSLGGLILAYVFLRVVFPTFSYTFESSPVRVVKFETSENFYISITPSFDYPYSEAKIWLEGTDNYEDDIFDAKLFGGYVSQLYPEGEVIETQEQLRELLFLGNETEIPNGSLFSYKDAVYFVSQGKARPFWGADIFTRLGFDWEKVQPLSDGSVFFDLEKGEEIDSVSPHLDGTILETDDGRLFLIWESKKRPIASKELVEKIWGGYYVVRVSDRTATLLGACDDKVKKSKIACKTKMTDELELEGDSYSYEVSKDVFDKTDQGKIRVTVFGNFAPENAVQALSQIKHKLSQRYKE